MTKDGKDKLYAALILMAISIPFAGGGIWSLCRAFQGGPGAQDSRWTGFVGGAVFCLIGFGLLYGVFVMVRSRTPDATLPWLARADWASGRVRGLNRMGWCIGCWILTAFVGTQPAAFVYGMVAAQDRIAKLTILEHAIFAIGFPIITLACVMFSLRATARALRYPRCFLALDALPVVPGGIFTGYVDCTVPAQLEPAFTVALQSVERWSDGSGDRRSDHTELLWREDYECLGLTADELPGGSRIPVQFEIPASAKPCGSIGGHEVTWTLSVSSSLPGLDFTDEFAVPVFASGPDPSPAAVARERRAPPSIVRRPVHDHVRIDEGAGVVRVVFPPAMNPGMAMIGTGVLIVFAWMSWAYARQGEALPAALSSSIALPSLYAAARAWFLRTTVVAGPSTLAVEKSLLGVGWRREFDGRLIESIDAKLSLVGSGSAGYSLSVTAGKRKRGFGSMMRSKSEAEYIRKLLLATIDADKPAPVPG